ncbi:MAG: hypothetical protein RL173_3518 [Fibrobacterota bacterium]
MGRTFAILGALIAGILLPTISVYSGAIRWILCAMLFLGFLSMPLSHLVPRKAHLRLLLAWPMFMAAGWFGLLPFGREAALAGLLVAATPTATAAPVITGFLGGDVGFVSFSFLASNLIGILFLPPLLAGLSTTGQIPSLLPFALSTAAMVGGPLAASFVVRRVFPAAGTWNRKLRHVSFSMWLCALVLAGAKTSDFLRNAPGVPWGQILAIAIGTFALCTGQFLVGRKLGGVKHGLEAGQSLGQKNTMLTLWLGLSACGPVAAMGPAFYVLWHNLWNGFQLGRRKSSKP